MRHRDIWAKGCEFLPAATRRLAGLRFAEIAKWPEWPEQPQVDLEAPPELSSVRFTVMKDSQADGSIRVAIQMYRHRFLGIGAMRADGFFISPEGGVRWFTDEDTWAVT